MTKIVTWWEDGKFVRKEAPARWVEMQDDKDVSDWHECLTKYSYTPSKQCGSEYTYSLEIITSSCRNYIVIDMSNFSGGIAYLFVSKEWNDYFFFSEFPKLYSVFSHNETLRETMEEISKFFLSFIRHGSGKHVVSSYGETYDDRLSREAIEKRDSLKKGRAS